MYVVIKSVNGLMEIFSKTENYQEALHILVKDVQKEAKAEPRATAKIRLRNDGFQEISESMEGLENQEIPEISIPQKEPVAFAYFFGYSSQMNWALFCVSENSVSLTKIEKAKQCLVDNGIEKEEAETVLQAICYILKDEEIFPD